MRLSTKYAIIGISIAAIAIFSLSAEQLFYKPQFVQPAASLEPGETLIEEIYIIKGADSKFHFYYYEIVPTNNEIEPLYAEIIGPNGYVIQQIKAKSSVDTCDSLEPPAKAKNCLFTGTFEFNPGESGNYKLKITNPQEIPMQLVYMFGDLRGAPRASPSS